LIEKNNRTVNFKNLSPKRRGFSQKALINGNEIILQTGEYKNGNLGEIFVNMAKESPTNRALLESFAIAVSLGLQYGIPLEEFVDRFIYTRFDPSGFVEHPNIKSTTSVLDFIFRVLAYEYLGRTDLVHILDKPDVLMNDDDWDEIPTSLEYEKKPELSSVKIIGQSSANKK